MGFLANVLIAGCSFQSRRFRTVEAANAVLADLKTDDALLRRPLARLRRGLEDQVNAGTPWRERDNLDVIAYLDPPTWATRLGLLDECPVVPRGPEGHSERRPLRVTTEFEFVSENSQVTWARDFVESLPGRLSSSG